MLEGNGKIPSHSHLLKKRIFAALIKKVTIMATYTININERTTFGKQLLLFLKGLGIIVESPKKGSLSEAIADYKTGNTTKCKDFDDYLKKINE